jgi:hypothetical protein
MENVTRRSFAAKIMASLAALGAVSSLGRSADAQIVWTTSEWKLSAFQQLLRERARVKQLFDITQVEDGAALAKIKNSLNGLHFGFGLPLEQIKVIGGLHGPANLLNFDDYIWSKYRVGEWLNIKDPQTGQPATRNPYYPSKLSADAARITPATDRNAENSPLQDASMQGLQRRGVRFLGCHTALEYQVRQLIQLRGLSQDPETIVQDMLAHIVPGASLTASMASAIALLQAEGQYTYIKV